MKTLKMFTVFTALILLAGSLYAGKLGTRGNVIAYGSTANGIQLYDSNLLPGSDDTHDLGTSSVEWQDGYFDGTVYCDGLSLEGDMTASGDVTISGDLSVDDVLNTDDGIVTISSDSTTVIPVASSFVILTSTDLGGTVLAVGTGGATISTATANAGDWLVVTSTATGYIRYPVGAAHYVVGPSSPGYLNTNDSLLFVFDGSYWVQISSSVNN